MKYNLLKEMYLLYIVPITIFFVSCSKDIDVPLEEMVHSNSSHSAKSIPEITPYQFERINENNFFSQGWKEQQVNIVSGTTIFSEQAEYVEIVHGPKNNTDPRLIQGSITMNLPTSDDATLRRVRLRRGGYTGTRLADLTELKYSTYVIQKSPTAMVLQVDINNDDTKDFNIFYNPLEYFQGLNYIPVVYNTWQQWDALHGLWHIEAGELPEFPDRECTIEELIRIPKYANARIIDTAPIGHNGEGVRFTIGGTPRQLFDNTIGYFDALIIGTKDRKHSILFDFASN